MNNKMMSLQKRRQEHAIGDNERNAVKGAA